MGLTLPNSSTTPATSPAKMRECAKAASAVRDSDVRTACETYTDFVHQHIDPRLHGEEHHTTETPHKGFLRKRPRHDDGPRRFHQRSPTLASHGRHSRLADLAPSGKYMAADLFDIGGMPSVMKLLVAADLLDGSIPTVTGKTLAENIEGYPSLPQDQVLIRPLNNPIKPTGHIEILRGNLAPQGAVAKITGKEGLKFTGKAIVFNKEHELDAALNAGQIPHGENVVVVVRYEGPKGGT
jgi:dihydroxy-acid dehydratase